MDYLLPLQHREDVAEGTMAFWFGTSGTDFTFTSGQNADFTLLDPPQTDAEGNTRTFSFASSPHYHDRLMVATRMRPTAFKESLKLIPFGTSVKVVGPSGDMTLPEDVTRPIVMLAGGIGITPFRSMVEYATQQGLEHDLTLFYANRTRPATAFLEDLEAWANRNRHLRIVPAIADEAPADWRYERGRIDRAMLERHLTDVRVPRYYLAGPDAFVAAMQRLLLSLGVSRDDVRSEEFTGY